MFNASLGRSTGEGVVINFSAASYDQSQARNTFDRHGHDLKTKQKKNKKKLRFSGGGEAAGRFVSLEAASSKSSFKVHLALCGSASQ